MSGSFAKTLTIGFEDAGRRTNEVLKQEGFGIITEIDVRDTFKKRSTSISGTTGASAPTTRRWL